jgi:ankyrin repeat protein
MIFLGAKYDGVNIHGATVLLTGTRNGHRSCVQLLVEKGITHGRYQ